MGDAEPSGGPGPSLTARLKDARPALPRWRPALPAGLWRAAAWCAVATPALVMTGSLVLAWSADRSAARLEAGDAPRRALLAARREAHARRPALAMLETRPAGTLLALLSDTLPPDDRLSGVAVQGGRATLSVETSDAEALRRALSATPALASLRATGESATEDGRTRVTLAGRW